MLAQLKISVRKKKCCKRTLILKRVTRVNIIKDYMGGFLKGKEGRISCRRQNMKGNYRKLAANSIT